MAGTRNEGVDVFLHEIPIRFEERKHLSSEIDF